MRYSCFIEKIPYEPILMGVFPIIINVGDRKKCVVVERLLLNRFLFSLVGISIINRSRLFFINYAV